MNLSDAWFRVHLYKKPAHNNLDSHVDPSGWLRFSFFLRKLNAEFQRKKSKSQKDPTENKLFFCVRIVDKYVVLPCDLIVKVVFK